MEAALADDPKKHAANKEFKKARQAEEGKRAMTEYENSAIASRAVLARDAEEAAAAALVPPKPVKKKKAAKKKEVAVE